MDETTSLYPCGCRVHMDGMRVVGFSGTCPQAGRDGHELALALSAQARKAIAASAVRS